MSEIKNLG